MFPNNISVLLGAHRYYLVSYAFLFSVIILLALFVQYQPLQNGRVVWITSPSSSSDSSFLDVVTGGDPQSHFANAQATVPPLITQQCERRGFPDGISTGQPPQGMGLLVVEKQVCGHIPMPASFYGSTLDPFHRGPGNALPADFDIRVTGNIAIFNPSTNTWTNAQESTYRGAGTVYLRPGIYNVFETLPTRVDLNTDPNQPSRPNYGYVPAAYEGECRNVSISAGETKHCTIKNHPLASKNTGSDSQTGPFFDLRPAKGRALLIFQKVLVNDDGGTAGLSDFSITATNNGGPISSFGNINTQTWGQYSLIQAFYYNISPGSYDVREITNPALNARYLPAVYLGDVLPSTTSRQIRTVTASGNDGNIPSNVLDNNLSTRWASLALGSWIRADLGSSQSVCGVNIAWYNGNARQYHFVIAASTDGSTFSNVFSGDSSGTTSNFEKYTFPANNVRYIKVTVNGNTANNWASMYELQIFGPSSPSATCATNVRAGQTILITSISNDRQT